MNPFQLFIAEIKSVSNKKKLLGAFLVLLVPLVYVAILLSPDWGPYDNVDNLPVAVVNNDTGGENNGEPIHVGDDLVENLKANPSLGWDFVTNEEASQGLEDMDYFMVIEIPENFSSNAVSVLDENPQKAELNYIQNEGLHFMAAQVTDNAIEQVRSQVSTEVTKTYVRSLFGQLGDVTTGFQEASDGSNQIYDGSEELKDGTEEILSSLNGSSDDVEELASGSSELEEGANELLQSISGSQGDVNQLAEGSQELNEGTGTLLSNLQENAGDVDSLAEGSQELSEGTQLLLDTLQENSSDVDQLTEGAGDLNAGANDAKEGSEQLIGGLGELEAGSAELAAGVQEARAGVEDTIGSMELLYQTLQTLPNNHPELEDDLTFNIILNMLDSNLNGDPEEGIEGAEEKLASLDELVAGANQLNSNLQQDSEFGEGLNELDSGLGQLVQGSQQLSEGTVSINDGWNELITNVEVLNDGASQLEDGNTTLAGSWTELTNGASELHAGSTQLADGNQTLNSSWQELIAGSSQIHDGSTQISEGNETVAEGWNDLTDGVTQVDDGILDLQSGADELSAGLADGVEQTGQLQPGEDNMTMFASPVELNGEVVNGYQFYRDSMVPYIMSLALFAGIVAMTFIIPVRRPEGIPASGTSWYVGKVMNLGLLAILQAILISAFALLVLNVQVQSSLMFILFSIGVSLTFLMLVLFLVAAAGNVGRFIALVIAVLQLSITGSELPIQMLPAFYRELSTYLPFTYSIDGFNSIVTLGNFSNVWSNAGVLLIYFVIFGVLSFLVYLIKYRYSNYSEDTLQTQKEVS